MAGNARIARSRYKTTISNHLERNKILIKIARL